MQQPQLGASFTFLIRLPFSKATKIICNKTATRTSTKRVIFGPSKRPTQNAPNEFGGYEYWGDRLGEDQLSYLEAEEVKKVLKGAKDGTIGTTMGLLGKNPEKKPQRDDCFGN